MEGATRSHATTALVVAVLAATLLIVALASAPRASARSSDHGASFAVRCDFSHRDVADPIAHHGHPEMAHSHDFFGNTTTDADSTYESLLAGGTTYTRFEEDKAAYWIPTVSWNGKVLNSNRAVFYYRAGGKNHKGIQPYPAGLKIIAGGERRVWWTCGRDEAGKGSRTLPDRCGSEELGVRVIFPDCIDVARDGKPLLDSPNHRAHMAYSKRIDGKVRCPRSHPRSVPVLTMNATFPVPPTEGEVTLACSEGHACGASSMHADFFNNWEQTALELLVKDCINGVPPSQPRPEMCQSPNL